MKKSFCELHQYYPKPSEAEDFLFDFHRQLCLQQFSVLCRHHVKRFNDPRGQKNFLVAKNFKSHCQ